MSKIGAWEKSRIHQFTAQPIQHQIGGVNFGNPQRLAKVNFVGATATLSTDGRTLTFSGFSPLGAAGGDLSGNYPSPVVTKASTTWSLTGILTIGSPGVSPVNNFNPGGLSTASVVRIGGSGVGATITGMAGGTAGRIIVFENVDSSALYTFTNQGGTSTAANRFLLPSGASFVLAPANSVTFAYDGIQSRWIMVSQTLNGSSLPGGSSGNILVDNGSLFTSVAMTGDVAITSAGVATVNGLVGKVVSAASPSAGDILIFRSVAGGQWTDTTVTGDVTISATGVTAIGTNKVTNSQAAQMAAGTIKSNLTGGAANPSDNTLAAVNTALGSPDLLFSNTSVPGGNTVSNTVTTTKLTSQPTLPASVTAGSVIRLRGWGVYGTTGTPTINVQALLGSTAIATLAFITTPATVTNQGWSFELDLIVLSNTTVEAQSRLMLSSSSTTALTTFMPNTAPVTVTSVNSGVLAIQVTWGTAAVANTITLRSLSAEILPA